MKMNVRATAAVTLFSAFALAPAISFAQHRCDAPNGMIERRACAKAAEGPQALRRFVERTRGIYGLYYLDYARSEPTTVAGAASIEQASSEDIPKLTGRAADHEIGSSQRSGGTIPSR